MKLRRLVIFSVSPLSDTTTGRYTHITSCTPGMGLQVGRHQPVGNEVAVVGLVAELAAVGEPAFAARETSEQAVVLPLPDEPTLQAGRGRDHVPVVGERAVRVAHRMAVLAHDQGPVTPTVAPVLGDRVDRRIHRAHDIAAGGSAVDPAVVEHCALVVQRPRWVGPADPTRQRLMVAAVAGFVAERPHDHARMVAVTLDHSSTSRQPCRPVARVIAQARVVGVALDVGFVDDVHPDLVTEIEEPLDRSDSASTGRR